MSGATYWPGWDIARGVALLPDRDLDAAGSLKWLLDGLKTMSSDSRKLIRPLNF